MRAPSASIGPITSGTPLLGSRCGQGSSARTCSSASGRAPSRRSGASASNAVRTSPSTACEKRVGPSTSQNSDTTSVSALARRSTSGRVPWRALSSTTSSQFPSGRSAIIE